MCIRDRPGRLQVAFKDNVIDYDRVLAMLRAQDYAGWLGVEYIWIDWAVSYTHLRAHETVLDLVCRLLLEKNNNTQHTHTQQHKHQTTQH